MKVRKIGYILVLILSCFFVFDMDVNAETCVYPNCCEYSSGNTSVTLTAEMSANGQKVETYFAKLKYGGKTYNLDRMSWAIGETCGDDVSMGGGYVVQHGKCPNKLVVGFFGGAEDAYIGIADDSCVDKTYNEWKYEEEVETYILNLKADANEIVSDIKETTKLIETWTETYRINDCYNPEIAAIANYCVLQKNTLDKYVEQGNQLLKDAEKNGITGTEVEELKSAIQTANESSEKYKDAESQGLGIAPPGAIGVVGLATGDPMTCESLKYTETYKIVKSVFTWIQIAAPIMLVIFGVVDFTKAVAASDNDAIKKAQGAFVKRVIIAAIIILLPFIVDLLLSLLDGALGNNVSTCEISK